VLRDDGGSPDLGYPRTVQRTDGRLVTVHYDNVDPESERFIGATGSRDRSRPELDHQVRSGVTGDRHLRGPLAAASPPE
jgi:hypothetical protein